MRRREFIAALGSAAAWPLAARAQQGDHVRRVGILFGTTNDAEGRAWAAAFRTQLRELKWSDDGNVRLEERWGDGDTERIRVHAMELVTLKPDAILAGGIRALTALQRETRIIPIVFVATADLAALGIVASLARPGGNATGFTIFEFSLIGKLLEMLKQIRPSVARVGLVFHPDNTPAWTHFRSLESLGSSFDAAPIAVPVRDRAEIERAIAEFARGSNSSLIFPPDVFTIVHRELIVGLVAQHRLPAVYAFPSFVRSGGLMSYGVDQIDLYRRAASYVDRILRGERAGELPVQAPTKFELVINLKTARALGLEIPPMLLARADEVIE
jgi:putative ABC transport system substrate-binding protein